MKYALPVPNQVFGLAEAVKASGLVNPAATRLRVASSACSLAGAVHQLCIVVPS